MTAREKYTPTDEEMSKAQTMMTHSQEKASEFRERFNPETEERIAARKEYTNMKNDLGVTGEIWADSGGDIYGEIKGRKVHISPSARMIVLDGETFMPRNEDDRKTIKELSDKYYAVAKLGTKLAQQEQMIKDSRQEAQQEAEAFQQSEDTKKHGWEIIKELGS